MTIKIGGQEVQSVQGTSSRMSLLLWGQPGVGKTTLAATAPGKKLWVNFDPDGTDSVAQFENIDVVDLSGASRIRLIPSVLLLRWMHTTQLLLIVSLTQQQCALRLVS